MPRHKFEKIVAPKGKNRKPIRLVANFTDDISKKQSIELDEAIYKLLFYEKEHIE